MTLPQLLQPLFPPVGGLAVYTLSHLLISNVLRGRRYLTTLVIAAIPGLVAAALLHRRLLGLSMTAESLSLATVNLLTYLCLAWCYFHFINIMVASLRIRLIREMAAAGSLSQSDILGRYDARAVVDRRLERLLAGGHLARRADGRLTVGSPFFLVIFDLFQMLKVAILGRGNRLLPVAGVDPGGFAAAAADVWRILRTGMLPGGRASDNSGRRV